MIPQPAIGPSRDFRFPRPLFRLEKESEEETRIRDLDLQIDQLIQGRNEQYEKWIKRLTREIEDVENQDRTDYLKGLLERAERSYSERRSKTG